MSRDDLSPATEAYLWGFPLVSVQRTRLLLCSKTPTGVMNHVDNLATPKDKAIVAPNNDTLYSSAWFDLSHGDITIKVPPMDHGDRYWNVMIVDAYTHVTYVCRREHGVSGATVTVSYDPEKQNTEAASELVFVATPTAWVIVRVLVESAADIEQARQLQRAIKVIPPDQHPNELTERAGRAPDIGKAGADFFTELKRYVDQDPPARWHMPLSAEAQALVNDPTRFEAEELEAAVIAGEKLIKAGNTKGTRIKNGWSTGLGSGSPDTILKRATGAKFGLGGHYAIENRSYIAVADSQGGKLNGSTPLLLKFEANNMPPCHGFWSLTAYGMDLYLVENEIDRWSLGDRTPGLMYAGDGSLTIILSAEKPEQTSNWLPVPDGPYMLGLRVYEGHHEVIECNWFPPALAPDQHN